MGGLNRDDLLARLDAARDPWDVLVVGGGATGLGTPTTEPQPTLRRSTRHEGFLQPPFLPGVELPVGGASGEDGEAKSMTTSTRPTATA
jgi:hypothetical protein